jgi:hypothetical protein
MLSIANIGFLPNINSNGEKPVDSCFIALFAKTSG